MIMKSTHIVCKGMRIIGDNLKSGLKKRCELSARRVPKRGTLTKGRDVSELMNSTGAYKRHNVITEPQRGRLNWRNH